MPAQQLLGQCRVGEAGVDVAGPAREAFYKAVQKAVDDEAAARRGLCRRLSAEAEVEVVGECEDGPTAVAAISESSPDVVFLDVQMPGMSGFEVIDAECVGCALCASVCPVENCITMEAMTMGVDPRTRTPIDKKYANWTTHPNNPMRKVAAE